jgi:hypothetical protein
MSDFRDRPNRVKLGGRVNQRPHIRPGHGYPSTPVDDLLGMRMRGGRVVHLAVLLPAGRTLCGYGVRFDRLIPDTGDRPLCTACTGRLARWTR